MKNQLEKKNERQKNVAFEKKKKNEKKNTQTHMLIYSSTCKLLL